MLNKKYQDIKQIVLNSNYDQLNNKLFQIENNWMLKSRQQLQVCCQVSRIIKESLGNLLEHYGPLLATNEYTHILSSINEIQLKYRLLNQIHIRAEKSHDNNYRALDRSIREKIFMLNYQIQTQTDKAMCIICIGDNAFAKLQCQHSFHINCIKRWFKKSNTCPSCRYQNTKQPIEKEAIMVCVNKMFNVFKSLK